MYSIIRTHHVFACFSSGRVASAQTIRLKQAHTTFIRQKPVVCDNKLIIINVNNETVFKKVFNGDTAYIKQLIQQKSKRCYYFCSTSP